MVVDVADGDDVDIVAAQQETEMALAAEAGADDGQADFCRGGAKAAGEDARGGSMDPELVRPTRPMIGSQPESAGGGDERTEGQGDADAG